jgi:hypothetical protein
MGLDQFFETVDVFGQDRRPRALPVAHKLEAMNPVQLRAGRDQPGFDRVLKRILGDHQEHLAVAAAAAVGHHIHAADAGGQIEQQGALAQAGVAIDDRDLA